MALSLEQLAEAAYEQYRYRLQKTLHRKGRQVELKKWRQLASVTKESWVAAVAEVVVLTRPRSAVMRELGIRGLVALRVAVDEEEGKK